MLTVDYFGIIPARGGSKRIIKKNIAPVNNVPMIAYTIKACQDSKLKNNFIVSTDSEEIAEVAQSYSCNVPFLRPKQISGDKAKDIDFLLHAYDWFKDNKDTVIKNMIILRPSSPLRTYKVINECISEYEKSENITSMRSVTKSEGVHHPYWMFSQDENGMATPFVKGKSIEEFYQSQLLPPCFRLNGCVDIFKTENLLNGNLYGEKMKIYNIDRIQGMEIDTQEDLTYCEFLLRMKLNEK